MSSLGFDRPLYVLPFDHRGSFQSRMFGWAGALTAEQTAEIAVVKRVMVQAIRQLQEAQVEPDVWKVEGLERPDDCERIVAA